MAPNVLLIGAPRSGTTFLFSVLSKHPDIFAPPVKEPHFHLADRWPLGGPEHEEFTVPLSEYLAGKRDTVWGGLMVEDADYDALYADAGNAPWRLEATPNYFAEGAWMADRLRSRLGPDTRVIVVLRDPVARAMSHHSHFRKIGWETRDFADAIASGPARCSDGWAPTWDYLRYSAYATQLSEWKAVFGQNVYAISFEDLTWQPTAVIEDLQRWLGVTPRCDFDAATLNGAPGSREQQRETACKAIASTGRLDVAREAAIVNAAHNDLYTPPLITIGMPVLNGEKTIRASLESLLSQSYDNIRIVVCDNASTDETAAIVKEMAAQDTRLSLKHFETRGDIRTSYERAFATAEGEYFMFAPCDDLWAPQFIGLAVQQMQISPQASVCCGTIEMLVDGEPIGPSEGVREIKGPPDRRWRDALIHTVDAARLYGLLRVAALPGLIPGTAPEGWDHYVAAKLALRGEVIVIDTLAMRRDQTTDEAYLAHVLKQEPTFWRRVFYLRHVRKLFMNDPEFKTASLGAQMTLLGYMLIHSYLPLVGRPKLYDRFRKTGNWLGRTGRKMPL